MPSRTPCPALGGLGALTLTVLLAGGLALATASRAQPNPVGVRAEEGPRWHELSLEQRSALKPLEKDWPGIDVDRKQKWVVIANSFPKLPADERGRIQARMSEWAQMSPHDRGRARLNYQEAKQASPQDRKAQWEAYQALPDEQKRNLADRARAAEQKVQPPALQARSEHPDTSTTKSNIVPNPAHAQAVRPVAPTIVQAQPGATTTLVTKRPVPPAHQQTGLPKIAATPEFVDRATLLPQRGPQGAATRSASASESQATLRR
jgi:hypothetical protein